MRVSAAGCRRAILGVAVTVWPAAGAAVARAEGPGAPLTEPRAALEQALECRGELRGAGRPAVILVHGTGSSPEESFSFGYRHVLPKRGFPVCTVRLPEHGLADMQRSIQYVVHAVREVARRSERAVSLVGHSQGATLAAYAPYVWTDLAPRIDDVIGLAGVYRGTTTADSACAHGSCSVVAWQFRTGSALNRAYRARPRPAGPSFTAIATRIDELVTPAPQAARLDGASNIVIQDLCPISLVDHFLLPGDAVAYALALDALTHPGPADPSRVDRATCLQTIIPGADLANALVTAPVAIVNALLRGAGAPNVDREPALQCPFDPGACPGPQLRLTRRCADGRLRIALVGDVDAVRDVEFKLGRRLVRRDVARPFTGTAGARELARAGRARLRAVARLQAPSGRRVILSRSLPRCGARSATRS